MSEVGGWKRMIKDVILDPVQLTNQPIFWAYLEPDALSQVYKICLNIKYYGD